MAADGVDLPPARDGRRRAGAVLGLLLTAAGCLVGLSGCTAGSRLWAERVDGKAVILLTYTCLPPLRLDSLEVGRAQRKTHWFASTTYSRGPVLWSIAADSPSSVAEVTPGTVPSGYHSVVDQLHGDDLGLVVWARETAGGTELPGDEFDLSKVQDGQFLDPSGNVKTRDDYTNATSCP